MRDMLRQLEEADGAVTSVKLGPVIKEAQFIAERIGQFRRQLDKAIQQLEKMGKGGPSRELMDTLREQSGVVRRGATACDSIVSTIKQMASPR